MDASSHPPSFVTLNCGLPLGQPRTFLQLIRLIDVLIPVSLWSRRDQTTGCGTVCLQQDMDGWIGQTATGHKVSHRASQ